MSRRFDITPSTSVDGVFVLTRKPVIDDRGAFERLFCADELAAVLGGRRIVQMNAAVTHRRGAVRGFHLQNAPAAEMKLIACLRGAILDVALDLRGPSDVQPRYHAVELSAGNARSLVIPEGVAHGFQALTDDVLLVYAHTAPYTPETETGVCPLDPMLADVWPTPPVEVSARDRALPTLAEWRSAFTS